MRPHTPEGAVLSRMQALRRALGSRYRIRGRLRAGLSGGDGDGSGNGGKGTDCFVVFATKVDDVPEARCSSGSYLPECVL